MNTNKSGPQENIDLGNSKVVNIRDKFDNKTKEILAKRVGYLCSNPDCKNTTSGPHTDPKLTINIGVAAHITAASPGGPRYDSSLTPSQRRDSSNGIWLCQNCSKLIDSDTNYYSKDLLQGWKHNAENHAKQLIERELNQGWATTLPEYFESLISLELTTSPPIGRNIGQSSDGQFWLVLWDSRNAKYQWSKITEKYAEQELQSVCKYRNVTNWQDLFEK
ncbi:hypothetical protein F1728_06600 [Gimesia benthica]|uniref:HNH endonuclease n=1 Tax=Gimesia benthica TaxID=2608982 RepID=A0A6I6A9V4_9PLAN|nr:hypothetical protein [Gimesia benthica]QGQ22362.1 hypothetical protein F1728_06600 [Gimesia benthica]